MKKPTTKELMQSLNKAIARLENHVGANGDAHMLATKVMAGFMSPADKQFVDSNGRTPTVVDEGTDCLALDSGLYICKNWKNAPADVDDSFCVVEVIAREYPKYVKINFFWISGARRYDRYIYKIGGLDSGWVSQDWTKLALQSGFSGSAVGKKTQMAAATLCEIKFEVTKAGGFSDGDEFLKLPSGWTTSQADPIYTMQMGSYTGESGIVPCAVVLAGQTSLKAYHTGGNSGITKVSGQIVYTR